MKKSSFLSVVLLICVALCASSIMAQSQSRVEKLLRYLNENNTEKWQKSRDKLDDETAAYYSEEVALIDAMNELWNKKNEEAVSSYFGTYDRAAQAMFPNICKEQKLELTALTNKTDKAIIDLLEASKDKLNFSRIVLDSIHKVSYPITESNLQKILSIRELALVDSMEKSPNPKWYTIYAKEYPKGRFMSQINEAQNAQLYQTLKSAPAEASFKAFFENPSLQAFYKDKGTRAYQQEVRGLYDDYLYQQILSVSKSGTAIDIKKAIDNYLSSPYLEGMTKKHLKDIEYLSEKVDLDLLKSSVTNSEQLKLIKDYLVTHRFKEFRDLANALRSQYEAQVIVSSPNSIKFYTQGLLVKSTENLGDRTITTTYAYNDRSLPASIVTVTEVKGQEPVSIQTNMLYTPQGFCALEVQVDPKTKAQLYRRIRNFTPEGVILSDSLKYADGRLTLSSYDAKGKLKEAKEFGKNGEILSTTVHKYNDNGWLVESQHQNMAVTSLSPTLVLSQKDFYEYNEYGYLTKLSYQKILANTQKIKGSLKYLYDEYGNLIDGNSYYEYDDTGRWISKTPQSNPDWVERVQYIYK